MLIFPELALLPSGNGIPILVYGWSANVAELSWMLAFEKLVHIKFP